MIGRSLALVLLLTGAATAQALDVGLESYLAATKAGATGAVVGRVFEERRRPEAAERPVSGVSVTLVPRSAEFLRQVEEIKRNARDSAASYRGSAPSILSLKAAYEKTLWEAGAADLVRGTGVDDDGRFTVENLAEGDWVLIATHSVSVDKHSAPAAPEGESRRRKIYKSRTRMTGYQVVSIWLREISVTKGGSVPVDLMDRNVWLSGIVENRAPGDSR